MTLLEPQLDRSDDVPLRADRRYAAGSAMEQTERRPRRLGIAEIVRFLDDPGGSLSVEQQRTLFADQRLRTDYRRLARTSVAELPAVAAASSGNVNSRRFDGGTVNIHPSRVPGQIYVVVRFGWPAGPPRAMLLEGADGDLIKRALPTADPNGEVLMVLDEKSDADAGFLRLISDPTSTGSILL